jgi:putative ABC transport system permease protein
VTAALGERPGQAEPGGGGLPARRAVTRWGWRMFRREWRQQLLILALVTVAVAATVIGAAVAVNTPPPADAGFGTAANLASFPGSDTHLASQITTLRQHFGRVDVIENQTITVPGSVSTFDLRAQDPHGAYGGPMLSLVSGRYPAGPGEVALTRDVASTFGLKIGSLWHLNGTARRVVGIVENPESLLDEFALVVPGQVTTPTQVTVLFDAMGAPMSGNELRGFRSWGPVFATPQQRSSGNVINPQTIAIAGITVGMLLIALVAVGGFTVLAQRRLRAIGMLGAQGATDSHIRLVVQVNGAVTGAVGAVAGLILGLAAWLAYRPRLEQSAHHVIKPLALPWLVVVLAMVLAVVATFLAASRPARALTHMPVVTALSGRPAPPKQIRRSALPGLAVLAAAFALVTYAGSRNTQGGALELVLGLVALVAAVILLAPFCLSLLGRASRHAPVTARLALRDLARYRARSGSALAAITIGVLIAALICVEVAARYGNVLDYVGPNLAPNQIAVTFAQPGGPGEGGGPPSAPSPQRVRSMAVAAHGIAAALGSHDMIQLNMAGATLLHNAAGRQWSGPIYVATPQLLHAFGIRPSDVDPAADILTMRPGMAGESKMLLVYGNYFHAISPNGNQNTYPCPHNTCLANPVIQEVRALPSGTSAPNTVITEHAIQQLHLHSSPAGWLIETPHPPTAAQIHNARLTAASAGLAVETRSSVPTSSEVLNWATVFGMLLALVILAMSLGLIRSETASDLRTLTATGASPQVRRAITAVTAGALALLGAVLGVAAAYVGAVAFARGSSLDGLSSLANVPVRYLAMLGIGMPLIAAAAGWLLAGREPAVISRRPLE